MDGCGSESDALTYPVVEIFKSVQGEGFNTGREMVFLRLGGCNLACPWCDTAYDEFEMLNAAEIMRRVDALCVKSLLVTGGEPLIVAGLKSLVGQFKVKGYWIAVETNGLDVVEDGILDLFDYISVSPKAGYAALYHDGPAVAVANEVRVVAEGNVLEFCRFVSDRIRADHYFLSPCDRDGEMNIEQTVRLLGWLNLNGEGPEWLLSLQTHKFCGLK